MTDRPPAWHVDHVKPVDDRKLYQIMVKREQETGDVQTKSGTIRRAVRELWRKEVSEDGE